MAGLPWKLAQDRIKDLVTYVVCRINTRRTTALNDNVAPRIKFTGRKINFKKEYALGFGDYVEAYDPSVVSNRVQEKRTQPCIALYPSTNINGSWIMWNIETKK